VISGIIHVLKSGGRWVNAPAAYGPRKTLAARSTSRMRRTDLLMPGCQ
jgi:transposase